MTTFFLGVYIAPDIIIIHNLTGIEELLSSQLRLTDDPSGTVREEEEVLINPMEEPEIGLKNVIVYK